MVCKRCGGDHFNFVKCEDHAAKRAEQARRERAPERFFRPREGERDFGNVTHTYQAHGANVSFIPRKIESAKRWEPKGGIVEYPKIFPDEYEGVA